MSVQTLVARYEAEKAEIAEKMAKLTERSSRLDTFLGELRRSAPKGKRGTAKKKPARKAKRKKSGVTVKDAILTVVGDAKEPLTPGEIIPGAAELSGGAVPSIRSQINTLAKAGALTQLQHAGRGYKYAIAGSAPVASKKATRKRATRKAGAKK